MRGALESLGLTLLHSAWQAVLVAAALGVILVALRRRGPEARYVACCAALAACVVLPLVTFVQLHGTPAGGTDDRAALPRLVPPVPAATLAPLLPWVATGWLCGVGLLQARLGLLWLRTRRLRRTGVAGLPPGWDAVVDDLRGRLGLRRAVRVVRSSIARVPMVVGWLQPVVLVPVEAFTGLDRDQLRAVVAHELAHVRRHDVWMNLVQVAIETLLFYHPAVWWISERARAERECCCDDLAVRACGDRRVYAHALARLDALRDPLPALAATGGSLVQRIERLLRDRDRPAAPSTTGPALAAVALAGFVVASGFAIASETRPAPPEPPTPPPPVVAPAPPAPPAPRPASAIVPADGVGPAPATPDAPAPASPVVAPAPPVARPLPGAAPPRAPAPPVVGTAVVAPAPPVTHRPPLATPAVEPAPPAAVTPAREVRPARPARPPRAPAPGAPPVPPAPWAPGAASIETVPEAEPTPSGDREPHRRHERPAPHAEPAPVIAGVLAVPAPEPRAEQPPPAAPLDDEILRRLEDVRRLRDELDDHERRLLRLLERPGQTAPEP